MPKTKAEVADARVVLPTWERRPLSVLIEGITPLMTDRIPDWVVEDIYRKQAGLSPIPRPKRTAEDIFREAQYVISEEPLRLGFPAHGFRKCVCRAAQRHGDDSSLTLARMYGLVQVPDGLFEIEGSEPVMTMMSGRNKSRQIIPIIRPLWMPWRMRVEMTYSYPWITDEQVVSLINMAGSTIGIGAARVENGMTYGQFRVAEVN